MVSTLNGCAAHGTTFDACLDLFANAGGLRGKAGGYLYRSYFLPAYIENPDLAMKLLFHIRDILMGMGERDVFRRIVRKLADDYPESVIKNIQYFGTYGRFDDLFSLLGTRCEKEMIQFVSRQLKEDEERIEKLGEKAQISLLAKWMPSINTSSTQTVEAAKKMARGLGMSQSQYRKRLSALRRQIGLIETNLSQKEEKLDYEKIPSKAILKYREALGKKPEFAEYLAKVGEGTLKMNTTAVFPYEIVRPLMTGYSYWDTSYTKCKITENSRVFLDTMWKAKKEKFETDNALVVADGSGSMYGNIGNGVTPALIAQSLALFYAERNHGVFHNCFITFSEHPKLIEIKGKDLMQKLQYVQSFDEIANTNVLAVFRLILWTALKHKLEQKDMPSTLYIVSDMEFDRCAEDADKTAFEMARQEYEDAGYQLPVLVFHNVNSWQKQFPVKKDTKGTALTSGSGTAAFKQKINTETTPYDFMLQVLMAERYHPICA